MWCETWAGIKDWECTFLGDTAVRLVKLFAPHKYLGWQCPIKTKAGIHDVTYVDFVILQNKMFSIAIVKLLHINHQKEKKKKDNLES